MSGGAGYLQEEVRRWWRAGEECAEVMGLPLGRKVWRGVGGDWQGAGVGDSLEFEDHRAYFPGDDPRQINWQAYARTGEYSMKVYREEVRVMVDVVVDGTASQFYRGDKAARVVGLVGFVVAAARRAGISLRVWRVGGERVELLDAGMGSGLADRLVEGGCPGMRPAFERVELRGHSLRVVVSDLLFPGDGAVVGDWLVRSGGRGLVLVPQSRGESDPGWGGNLEFEDVESGVWESRRVGEEEMAAYRRAYAAHFAGWREVLRRRGAGMARVPVEEGLLGALQQEALREGVVEWWG